ncbi:MAG: cation diffusion facilitator family transporter [Clostridiales bacterium]|nr:cation diffusion facilitator family transporter [Clostridiales bacterium]
MITLLSRIFIRNYKDTQSPQVRRAYGMLCGFMGIFLNILLFLGKWLAGTISGSIAITADAFNNLSDAGSSLITLVGFHLSGQAPDREHPFGHGRMEYISGLFVSIAIILMGFELMKSSVEKILSPEPIECSPLILGILGVSILIKLYMYFYNHTIGLKIDSASMAAASTDSLSDMVSTTLVLLATLISQYTGLLLDGWFGTLVGLFIFYSGIKAVKETMDPLLGQPPKEEFVREIKKIVLTSPTIYGMHDLIVHDYGPGRRMISLHAEVPADGDLVKIHDEIDNIEQELSWQLSCSATIHIDPVITDDREINHLHEMTEKAVKEVYAGLSIHDFRVVKGTTHTNLIFDLLIPFDMETTEVAILNAVKEKIREFPGDNYHAVIQVDRGYC